MNIKVEKTGTFEVLGRRVTHTLQEIIVDQTEYVRKIQPVFIPTVRRKAKDSPLTRPELTQYQSLVQQLAWPARTTMPGLNYLVSDLQQKASGVRGEDLIRANFASKVAQQMSRDGASLRFRKFPSGIKDVMVVVAHDASFA